MNINNIFIVIILLQLYFVISYIYKCLNWTDSINLVLNSSDEDMLRNKEYIIKELRKELKHLNDTEVNKVINNL